MNENDPELKEAMRALAATGPREAPPHVERVLLATFRARAQRRRVERLGYAATAIAGMAAAVAGLFWLGPFVSKHRSGAVHAIQTTSPQSPVQPVEQAPDWRGEVRDSMARNDDVESGFYPTPEADELPPLETAVVVRVEMPMSSLRLMGFPVSEDSSADPIQADVLLGQDGLARGVRLVE